MIVVQFSKFLNECFIHVPLHAAHIYLSFKWLLIHTCLNVNSQVPCPLVISMAAQFYMWHVIQLTPEVSWNYVQVLYDKLSCCHFIFTSICGASSAGCPLAAGGDRSLSSSLITQDTALLYWSSLTFFLATHDFFFFFFLWTYRMGIQSLIFHTIPSYTFFLATHDFFFFFFLWTYRMGIPSCPVTPSYGAVWSLKLPSTNCGTGGMLPMASHDCITTSVEFETTGAVNVCDVFVTPNLPWNGNHHLSSMKTKDTRLGATWGSPTCKIRRPQCTTRSEYTSDDKFAQGMGDIDVEISTGAANMPWDSIHQWWHVIVLN
jgi:hypothetical protein